MFFTFLEVMWGMKLEFLDWFYFNFVKAFSPLLILFCCSKSVFCFWVQDEYWITVRRVASLVYCGYLLFFTHGYTIVFNMRVVILWAPAVGTKGHSLLCDARMLSIIILVFMYKHTWREYNMYVWSYLAGGISSMNIGACT